MVLLTCVLHSRDGYYGADLVSSVVSCVTSVFYSLSALSPDFAPQIAIFRSDPVVGCHCLYRSAVPDCNHAVKDPPTPYMAFSPTFNSYEAQQKQHSSVDGSNEDISTVFRSRSASFLSECILLGTRALPSRMEAGFKTADVWSSLAGGLLTSLAFLNKHKLENYQPSRRNPIKSGNSVVLSAAHSILLVFSDCTESSEVTYNTECAMAVAAVTAMRLNTIVFTFGKVASGEQADLPGSSRIRAFTISTGGFCAERFHPSLIGEMLDKSFAMVFCEGPIHDIGDGPDLPDSLRGRRDQLAEAYIVAPSTMPQGPSCGLNGTSSMTSSHLAWLCPRCMTVTQRDLGEGISANTNFFIDENDDRVVFCRYCDKL
ncbi:unnamed protein product [Phytomonas sp. EM1]|nr:unnamed protein product [Phytomonas sp. EM1]|eukprot:CCW60356.1 unnamed protein product [Phytomonas sp. isolate EM1]